MNIRILCAALVLGSALAHAQTVGSIEPPPGFKPVLTQKDGKWHLSFIPDPAASQKPGKSASSSSAAGGSSSGSDEKATLSRNDLEKSLNTSLAAIDWKRELTAIPAFVALDVSPETVARPTTPRDFAASLLNGVDRKGTLQSGIAIETAPYQLFLGRHTTLEEYRTHYWTRLLYRTSLSLATAKASNGKEDRAQRLALGLSITLFDKEDPYLDPRVDQLFSKALLDNRAPNALDLLSGVRPDMSDEEILQAIEKNPTVAAYTATGADRASRQFLEGLEAIRDEQWARTAWNVAWAPAWISESGNSGDLRWDGSTLWTTFEYGFETPLLKNKAQLLAHVRYRQGEHVVDPEDASKKGARDSLLAAASFRYHWAEQEMNFGIEGAYLQIWGGPNGDGHAKRIGGVLEKKVSDNMWLVLSLGQDFGGGGKDDELFALGSLRFGTEDKARFASQ